jgi:hypothetical protein
MATNRLLVVDMIGKNILARLINSTAMTHTANRDYEDQFTPGKVYQIGSTVRIRKPTYFTVVKGAALSLQAVIENQTYLTITEQSQVAVAFTSTEEQLFLEDEYSNVYEGAAQVLANDLDLNLAQTAGTTFYRTVGTAGAGISSFAVPNAARTMQVKYGVVSSKFMCFQPDGIAVLRNTLQPTFNEELSKSISQHATIGMIAAHEAFEDQNLPVFTTGTFPGTPIVAGAGQSGSAINLSGFTASQVGVLNPGDIISFAGVYGVNPVNRQQVGLGAGNLAQFTVLTQVNSDATGLATVTISPEMVLTGPYQNVTVSPAASAAVTCYGVTVPGTPAQWVKNFAYSRDALSLACVPGPISLGAKYSKLFSDTKSGLSVRANIVYNIQTDQDIIRFDMFYGTQGFGSYGTIMAS